MVGYTNGQAVKHPLEGLLKLFFFQIGIAIAIEIVFYVVILDLFSTGLGSLRQGTYFVIHDRLLSPSMATNTLTTGSRPSARPSLLIDSLKRVLLSARGNQVE